MNTYQINYGFIRIKYFVMIVVMRLHMVIALNIVLRQIKCDDIIILY